MARDSAGALRRCPSQVPDPRHGEHYVAAPTRELAKATKSFSSRSFETLKEDLMAKKAKKKTVTKRVVKSAKSIAKTAKKAVKKMMPKKKAKKRSKR
jgi:hypothetical protein